MLREARGLLIGALVVAAWASEKEARADGPVSNFCIGAPNSVGPGARMEASGSTSVERNDLVLEARGVVPHRTGLFFYGRQPMELPFGNGWLCVGGEMFRLFPLEQASPAGTMVRPFDYERPPANFGPGRIAPGDTCYFQCWYRDPEGGGSQFNLTDGLRVSFLP